MRAIFVIAIVLTSAWGLMSAAEPPQNLPPSKPVTPGNYAPPVATTPMPTVPAPSTAWATPAYAPIAAYATEPYPSYDQAQELRQQYSRLAGKRAERMDAAELKQGILEMQRHCLIAELAALANDADGFNAMRAAVAAMALKAKDQQELEANVRLVVKELESKKSTAEP